MILSTKYVIAVRDLAASADYYRHSLGFEIKEIGDPGWRMFERGSCQILAGNCPDSIPASDLGDHSYFAYLVVEEIDTLHQEFAQKEIEFVKALKSEPWGMREFGIKTVDGHRMMFGQSI